MEFLTDGIRIVPAAGPDIDPRIAEEVAEACRREIERIAPLASRAVSKQITAAVASELSGKPR